MKTLTILDAVNDALRTEMKLDPTVLVFGEDVGVEGGVFRATVGLQKEFGELRCFDTPLSEAGIVGTAIGMAVGGLKPVVEMQFDGFAWPAFNQIISHASRLRNRSRGAVSVPMVIRFPYGGGIRALEHHSESMEAIYAHVPGIKVVIPGTPYDTKGLLISSIRDPDPVIFIEPKRIYRSFKQEVPEEAYTIPLGSAKIIKKGKDLTLLSYGAQLKEANQASEELMKVGIDVELIDLRTIYPYDREKILESVKKTGHFLVVHEGPEYFGIGAELITLVTTEAFTYLEAPPGRLSGANTIFPLPRGEKNYMITDKMIFNEVNKIMSFIS